MTSDKRYFLNTPSIFNDNRFDIWKTIFRIFLESINNKLWKTIFKCPFIPTHQINDEVVDKPNFLWTKEEKTKFKIHFKTKSFITRGVRSAVWVILKLKIT